MPRPAYEVMELGYSAVGRRMLLSQVNAFKPDILYERYTLFNLAGLSAARRARIPLVLEVNAPLAYERAAYERLSLGALARRCERYVCSRADLVLVVSTPLREYLVGQGVPRDRIAVVPNGADAAVFRPDARMRQLVRARLGFAEHDVVVGFSGILRPWHGVDLLIEALARLTDRPNLKAMIVGDGPSFAALRDLVATLGLDGRVVFTGRVPHGQIPSHVSAFDIGLSPRATFYASPMKVPEYMAAGIAVVAPRMPNLQDLISDGVDGVLFTPDDVNDLADVLASLVEDRERRVSLGLAARASVVSRRTWRHNAAHVIGLLNEGRRECA